MRMGRRAANGRICLQRESIGYRGVPWHRYPDAEKYSDRYYYKGVIEGRQNYLHRQIWEDTYGEIPPGHEIHHKDGNPSNNWPWNLECLSKGEHSRLHRLLDGILGTRGSHTEEHRRKIALAVSEYAKTPEGQEVRSRGGKTSLAQRPELGKVCEFCGTDFTTKQSNAKWCSKSCQQKWRRREKVDYEDRSCAHCGNTFAAWKYGPVRFCSRSCAMRQRRADEAMGLRPVSGKHARVLR